MDLVGSSAGPRRRGTMCLAAALGVIALAATACSSDSKSTSSGGSGSSSSTADLSVLGTAKPATGTAVTIGMITEGGSEAIGSQSALAEQGAQIATQYVNEYLGGIRGKPIQRSHRGTKPPPPH